MKFQLRRYVWVIDLIGMLVGAGLIGHLVANQFVSRFWPQPILSEYAPSSGGRDEDPALCSAPMAVRRAAAVHDYELSRVFVADLLDRLGRLQHPTHIIPETADDHPAGVRLVGDLDGLFGAMGLCSGDLVIEANGFSLTHPSAMLAAYAALRQTREAWLVIARGGRRILLTYLIVDRPGGVQLPRSPRQAAANSSCVP